MLQNFTLTPPSIFKKMEESDFTFFLTGDRFWGNPKPSINSNPMWHIPNPDQRWDFFVQDSPEAEQWLTENDFVKTGGEHNYVESGECTSVYMFENEESPGVLIYVQLVKSALVKSEVQHTLRQLYPDGFHVENLTTVIWKVAFATYRLGLESGRKLGLNEGYKDGYEDARRDAN